jgi:hypothetical protein
MAWIIPGISCFWIGGPSSSAWSGGVVPWYGVYGLLVFFAPARYRVVKIACSYSKVVLRTTNHTIVYPGSDLSLKVIALYPVV